MSYDPGARWWSTAQVAALCSVTPRALRHYESLGLLPDIPRDSNGYRRYRAIDIAQLLRIRNLAATGMSLQDIKDVTASDGRSMIAVLEKLSSDLDRKIHQLEEQRAVVAELLDQPHSLAEFDRQVWSLAKSSGAISAQMAQRIDAAVASDAVRERVATLLSRLQALDGGTGPSAAGTGASPAGTGAAAAGTGASAAGTEVSADVIEELALELAGCLDAIAQQVELPADSGINLSEVIEELEVGLLSPAQRQVWRRFRAIIGADSDHN